MSKSKNGKALEEMMAMVERQDQPNTSKQPRFDDRDRTELFFGMFNMVRRAEREAPGYRTNSMERDAWLRKFSKEEPHLVSVIEQATAIDANRGWFMVGGRNQVRRFTRVAHEAQSAPGLTGWRPYISTGSQAFYTADINAIFETGRAGDPGPLAALYNVDPARCRLTGEVGAELEYSPSQGGGSQRWEEGVDYFRVASYPNTDETFNGLGFCAVSRCLQLAQIMVAIYDHSLEKLAARAPKGLLLLTGINEGQWDDAMTANNARLTARERDYFGGVAVLAQSGMEQIDAKLVALSQLPDGFDLKEWTDLLMYGYAAAFGYDAQEFWPVQQGTFGRGEEAKLQAEQASSKGQASFAKAYQEQFQMQLPDTLHFEFDERSDVGDLQAAEVRKSRADVIKLMAETTTTVEGTDNSVLTSDEIRELWAANELIPVDWTEREEAAVSTDEREELEGDDQLGQRMLEFAEVRRACEQWPDEPIIRYGYQNGIETERILWECGTDAMRRKSYPVAKIERQVPGEDVILFESPDGEVVITQADVDHRTVAFAERQDPVRAELMTAPTLPEVEQ